jgi:hypothetical protein
MFDVGFRDCACRCSANRLGFGINFGHESVRGDEGTALAGKVDS